MTASLPPITPTRPADPLPDRTAATVRRPAGATERLPTAGTGQKVGDMGPSSFRLRLEDPQMEPWPGWQPAPAFGSPAVAEARLTAPSGADLAAFHQALARVEAPPQAQEQVQVHLTQRWLEPLHVATALRQADGAIGLSLAAQLPAGAVPPLVTMPEKLRAMMEGHSRQRPDQQRARKGDQGMP